MRVTITDRCKVWDINDEEGYATVRFSTSRKVDETKSYDKTLIDNNVAKNGYVSDYRSFVRFVGHAYNQLKDIQVGDTITNLVADMSTEPYWSSRDAMVMYPKNEKITVFEFEKYEYTEGQYSNTNMDKAPVVVEEPVKAAPVQQQAPTTPTAPVAPTVTASEECPF